MISIALDYETVDRIITTALRENIEIWEQDMGDPTSFVFDLDPAIDRKITQEHINAANLLLSYYEV